MSAQPFIPGSWPVTNVFRGWALLWGAVFMCGCVEVSGGAIEARWDLRNDQGSPISCKTAGLSFIAFRLSSIDSEIDPCDQENRCQFSCERGVGSTEFVIPEGQYAISLVALNAEGKVLGPAEGVRTPEPVVRQVEEGLVTDLSVNLITVKQ